MSSPEKQLLDPVKVPWMISPSAPFLKLQESSEQGEVLVTFVGYFGTQDTGNSGSPTGMPEIREPGPEFHLSDDKAPYRLIRVSFAEVLQSRTVSAVSDSQVIRESDYDWHKVASKRRSGEKINDFLRRHASSWEKTGLCPNPRMYEVLGSAWLEELAPQNPLPWHHYLLLGHDEYVEVAARTWRWDAGQAL